MNNPVYIYLYTRVRHSIETLVWKYNLKILDNRDCRVPRKFFRVLFWARVPQVRSPAIQGVAIKKPDCFCYSFPAISMTKIRVGH